MKRKINVRIAISMSILLMLFSGLSAFGQVTGAVNELGMGSVYIKPGSFWMGDENIGPVHKVTISRGFWMGVTEVTQQQWQAVMGNNLSYFGDCGNCPVELVSWDEVQEFIKRLNARYPGSNYRLPTEAEWEYAARAGTLKYRALDGNMQIYLNRGVERYVPYKPDQVRAWLASGQLQPNDYVWHAGAVNWQSLWSLLVDPEEFSEEELDAVAWYAGNSGGRTHPVGTKKPNAWGLYDMHGNVWEWVQDRYGLYPTGAVTDPTGASSGSYRVLRGGSWDDVAAICRSAFRSRHTSPGIRADVGFRLVRY